MTRIYAHVLISEGAYMRGIRVCKSKQIGSQSEAHEARKKEARLGRRSIFPVNTNSYKHSTYESQFHLTMVIGMPLLIIGEYAEDPDCKEHDKSCKSDGNCCGKSLSLKDDDYKECPRSRGKSRLHPHLCIP